MTLDAFKIAVTFLTRIPLRLGLVPDATLGRAVAFFPLVGLLLGLGLALVAGLPPDAWSPLLRAAVVLGVLGLVTGGLHLDGLADTFDGLAGGAGDRERTLEIFRDSRIGAHGASAVVIVLLAQAAALAELLSPARFDGDLAALLAPVVLFPAVGRFGAALLVVSFRYARDEGLGLVFTAYATKRELVAAGATAGVACFLLGGVGALVSAGVAALVAYGFGGWLSSRLGGLTGDVYGAAVELSQLTFLVLLL